jgi:hypothetical protein
LPSFRVRICSLQSDKIVGVAREIRREYAVLRDVATGEKKRARAAREAELGSRQLSAPIGKFNIIVEDFEWDDEPWSRETGMDRHAANHYPVSDTAHTAEAIHERTRERFACAADDCLLAMWSTVQHLDVAIDLLRYRGFR